MNGKISYYPDTILQETISKIICKEDGFIEQIELYFFSNLPVEAVANYKMSFRVIEKGIAFIY